MGVVLQGGNDLLRAINAELLAALEAAVNAEPWGDQGDPEWAAQARAAIAKAKGEQADDNYSAHVRQ